MSGAGINQSVLSPAGVQASSIHVLWVLMLSVCTAVFIAVLAALLAAIVHGTRRRTEESSISPAERTVARYVGVAVGVTVATLIALLVASVWTGRTVASLQASSAISIAITGHQWWWEVQYEDAVPSRRVLTANEIHIPINRPVVLKVTSHDVIHSFWVPNLQGKRDLIPGYTTALWMQASRPGVFRGQVWGAKEDKFPVYSGVLATGGDVVFHGTIPPREKAASSSSASTAQGVTGDAPVAAWDRACATWIGSMGTTTLNCSVRSPRDARTACRHGRRN